MVQEEGTANEDKGYEVVEPPTVQVEETNSSTGCGLWIGDEAREKGFEGDFRRREQEEQIENWTDHPVRVADGRSGEECQTMNRWEEGISAMSRGCSMEWSSDASIPFVSHVMAYCFPAGTSSGRGGSSGMIPSFTSNFSSSPLWCTTVSDEILFLQVLTGVQNIGASDKLALQIDLGDCWPVTGRQRAELETAKLQTRLYSLIPDRSSSSARQLKALIWVFSTPWSSDMFSKSMDHV